MSSNFTPINRPTTAAACLRQPILGPSLGQWKPGFADGHAENLRGNQVIDTATGSPNLGKAFLPQTRVVWTLDPLDNPN